MVCPEVGSPSVTWPLCLPGATHSHQSSVLVILSPRLLSSLSPPTLSPALCTSTPIVTMGPYTALWTTPSPSSTSASWRREHSQKTHSSTRRFSFAGKIVWGRRTQDRGPKSYLEDLGGVEECSLSFPSVFYSSPLVMNLFNWIRNYY